MCCAAGIFCAIVSHPADTIVSKLNKDPGASFMGVAKDLGFAGQLHKTLKLVNLLTLSKQAC